MIKKSLLLKKKLLNLLIIVLLGYSFFFLIFLIKGIIKLFEERAHLEFNMTIAKTLIIEVVMIVLSATFAYICFRVRKNIKE